MTPNHGLRLAVYGGSRIALWCPCQAPESSVRYRGTPIEVRSRWTVAEAMRASRLWHLWHRQQLIGWGNDTRAA